MSKINLLVTEATATPFAKHVRDWADTQVFDLTFPHDSEPGSLQLLAPTCDAILSYQAPLGATVIDAAPRLKVIQKHGLNCRNIDLMAARVRGIPVGVMPLIRNITVAEHAMALMLACSRQLIAGHDAVRGAVYQGMGLEPTLTSQSNYRANWANIQGLCELYQATVGIVGMGDIGIEVAKRCRAFGMSIVYHQRTRHEPETENEWGIRYLSMDDLLATSDFVILVVPHTPQTEALIDARALAKMKSSATLINIGRGGLVDEVALTEALQSGCIAMAALDVYQREPLPADSLLLSLPNVVMMPHLGGGSNRSWEVDMPASLSNIRKYFSSYSS